MASVLFVKCFTAQLRSARRPAEAVSGCLRGMGAAVLAGRWGLGTGVPNYREFILPGAGCDLSALRGTDTLKQCVGTAEEMPIKGNVGNILVGPSADGVSQMGNDPNGKRCPARGCCPVSSVSGSQARVCSASFIPPRWFSQ